MLLSLRSPAPAAREDSDKSPVRTGRCGHAVLYEPLRFSRLSGQVWECTMRSGRILPRAAPIGYPLAPRASGACAHGAQRGWPERLAVRAYYWLLNRTGHLHTLHRSGVFGTLESVLIPVCVPASTTSSPTSVSDSISAWLVLSAYD